MARKMLFSNSAEAALQTPLLDTPPPYYTLLPDGSQYEDLPESWVPGDGSYYVFEVSDPAHADLFVEGTGQLDRAQPVTLTHDSMPGVFEIVHVYTRFTNIFEVFRAQEGTLAKAWPVGTKVSANVTAGMLESFLQDDGTVARIGGENQSVLLGAAVEAGEKRPAGTNSFVFRSRSLVDWAVQLGAYPVLQPLPAQRPKDREYSGNHYRIWQDLALAHESTGGFWPADIGAPKAWAAGSYNNFKQGAVFTPSTPNGYQYWADVVVEKAIDSLTFSEEPALIPGEILSVLDTEDNSLRGNLVPQVMPVVQSTNFRHPLMVTEVGFMGRASTDVTQMPVVSLGTEADPTRFANAVSLDSLVASGNLSVHRIPIAAGGALVEDIKVTVTQAGVGGPIPGRFYWRGVFMVDGGS
ncbi:MULTISPECIES: hypothetical protein [Comamonas]|uniref:hypothetical protein n=1 Tax=Comamonas TaxID=283 RepID=UPI0005F830E6|nr:hypothetical protein [Comamonas thiooxydans]CUB01441.1 hypothetical protein Ga0061062_11441 [Comamonas thiooxydans]